MEEFQEQANHRNEELERAQQLEYVPVEVKERGVSQAFKDRVTKEVADVRLSILETRPVFQVVQLPFGQPRPQVYSSYAVPSLAMGSLCLALCVVPYVIECQ